MNPELHLCIVGAAALTAILSWQYSDFCNYVLIPI